MEESGFCENSSGIGSEDSSVLVSSGPIECPLEKDGTLLLSTLQGQLPGASGLWFAIGNKRRAVRYDGKNGKLFPPSEGWNDRQYQVAFYSPPRQTCMGYGAFERYENATKTFQSSIDSVKQLMDSENGGIGGLQYETSADSDDKIVEKLKQQIYSLLAANEQLKETGKEQTSLKHQNEKLNQRIQELEKTKEIQEDGVCSQVEVNHNEAISNNYESREMYEEKVVHLSNELNEKKRIEQDLNGELQSARDRINDLEKLVNLKEQEHWKSLQVAQEQLRHQDEELQRLRNELNAAESQSTERLTHIRTLESSVNNISESERQLRGEIEGLKNEKTELQNKIDAELIPNETTRQKMNELSQRKAELKAEVNNLKVDLDGQKAIVKALEDDKIRLEGLLEQAKDTSGTISEEEKEKYEWELGEHRKWLEDCKNRIQELESILSGKDGELRGIYDTVQGLQYELESSRKDKDAAQWRVGELEASCRDKDNRIDQLQNDMAGMTRSLQDLEGNHVRLEKKVSNHQMDSVFDMSNELKDVHQKKYELESQVSKLQGELRDSNKRAMEMETEMKRLQTEIWCSNERKAQLEQSEGSLIWQRDDLAGKLHDSSNKVAWLEGEVNGLRSGTGETAQKCGELEAYRDKAARHLWDSFLVRKEAFCDRNKWILAMWNESKDEHYIRVWFEIDAPHARHVYLMASFFNWECALLCTMHDHGKWGVWVDIPRGRHEFRFLVDGRWECVDAFPKVPNEFGSDNNWRVVE